MKPWPFRRTLPPARTGADRDADIREELEFYLDLRTQELVDAGLDPATARAEAEARFGDPLEIERSLKRRSGRRRRREVLRMLLASLRQDLGYAVRTLKRNPGFALVAAGTLALALAGNTTLFSVLDAAVLRALPFPDHEQLVFVDGVHVTDAGTAVRYASVPEFRDWREHSRSISPMVAVDPNSLALSGDGEAERITGELVSEGFFDLLGGEPLLGRTFAGEEFETPDGFPLVILSHSFWERRFGGDVGVVGRTLVLNDRPLTVIGVMGPDFRGVTATVDAWIPLGMISLVGSVNALDQRGTRFLGVIGRLTPGSSIESAQTELDAIAVDLQQEHADSHEDRFARIESFRDGYLGNLGSLLWILVGAGMLLLTIAAANVANLLLVRAHARTRELVVRRAVGAGGSRLVSQLLTESVVLAAAGGVLGLVLAWWAIRSVTPMIPDGVLPAFVTPTLSARVFLFSLVVVGVAGLAAGLVPAITSGRGDLATLLRSGARSLTGRGTSAQQVFVVTQVGLALLLLVGAGLMTRSFRAQLDVEPGLELGDMHVFRLDLPRERYPDAASARLFAREVVRRVGDVPGVESAAASNDFPFRGRSSGSYIARGDDPETRIRYHRHSVTPGYFEHLGVTVLRGRTFDQSDTEDTRGVAVVTQALIDRVFPDQPDGLGQTIWIGNPQNPDNAAEIIGVVENVRYRSLTQDMMEESNSPDVFFAIEQMPPPSLEISLSSRSDLNSLLPAIREAVGGMDPAMPIYAPATLVDLYRTQTATPRFAALLMGMFSGLALLLACVGIYGVLAFSVGQRAPEIAVRRALGAQARDVAGSVVASAVRMAGSGLVIGGVMALFASRSLRAFLFEVEPTDPVTFVVVSAVMMLVTVVAALLPAYRATRSDPIEALNTN